MNEAAVAAELRRLASRVRCLQSAEGCVEQSAIAHDLGALAERVRPTPPRSKGKVITTVRIINGRRVIVQAPRPAFSVFVGGK